MYNSTNYGSQYGGPADQFNGWGPTGPNTGNFGGQGVTHYGYQHGQYNPQFGRFGGGTQGVSGWQTPDYMPGNLPYQGYPGGNQPQGYGQNQGVGQYGAPHGNPHYHRHAAAFHQQQAQFHQQQAQYHHQQAQYHHYHAQQSQQGNTQPWNGQLGDMLGL